MPHKDLSPADELYNYGLDTLDGLVERDARLAPFQEALDQFNRQGEYFQERPRQEEPSALSSEISLTSVFERLQRHAPPLELRTAIEEGPYRSVAPPAGLLQQITENRAFKYVLGLVVGASALVYFALNVQLGNLQKTNALLQQAQRVTQAQPSPSLAPKVRFAHPLTDAERAHTIPLVQSPVQNWPDDVGLEYDEINDFHDELRSLDYKSAHDKYLPLEEYVVSVCRKLKIDDTDLALALLGSGGMVDLLEYEDLKTVRHSIQEKLGEFKKLGLRAFLEREILGGRGGSSGDYPDDTQNRYRKLFREHTTLQGYHQELHNRREQNKNTPFHVPSLAIPPLRYPEKGASRLEWPEHIPCPDPVYQQQHLRGLTIGNEHNVINPGGIYVVTPLLTEAAKKRVVNLEIGISEGDHASNNFHHVGYYALPEARVGAIEIPFYFQPGVYNLTIAIRFGDDCEQYYHSTLRVTNDVFDRAQDQRPLEGIKLKMPKIYD